jgi:hypothetical protein
MALDTRVIKYVVTAETPGEVPVRRFSNEMKRAGDAVEKSKIQFLEFGKQGQVTARQMQALGYQTTDIITSLASGQQAWLVLLQQGGQLRDQFGGFTNVGRALLGVLGPMGVALLGVGAAIGVVAVGAAQGWRESDQLRKSFALTGNQAGQTAGAVDLLAQRLARLSGNSIGNAREAVLELVASGKFTAESLDSVGVAALQMQRLTGEAIGDIVKRFGSAREGVTKWAQENNRAYGYLTVAQYEYIRSLESQGRVQEALRVNFEALAQTMETRTAPALGTLERLWQGVKNKASEYWDVVKGIGRDTTLEEQLDKINKQIGAGENSANPYFKRFTLPGLRDQQAYLQEQLRLQRAGAERQARDAADSAKAIEEASKAHQDALGAIARAGTDKRLAQEMIALDARQAATERAHQRFEISGQAFRDRSIAVERGRLDAEARALQAQLQLEKQRVVEKPTDVFARDAAILQLETKILQVEARRAQVNREIADFKRAAAPARDVGESPQAAFRQLELQQQASTEAAQRERSTEAQKAARELLEVNRGLSAALIKDEEERGRRFIALEAAQQRQRLLITATSADQVKAIEDATAEYVRLREQQLTEELKPEWKKRLELYADSNRFARSSFNDYMDATTRSAEDAWVDQLTQGRNFAKALKSTIEQELARIGWRKYLAEPFARLMELIAKQLGGSGGGFLGGFFGGGGSGNLSEVGGTGAAVYHSGGVAGHGGGVRRTVSRQAFVGARRYHNGGVAREIPALLEEGEEILKRSDPRHVNNGGGIAAMQFGPFNFQVPEGMNPLRYAAAMEPRLQQLKHEIVGELVRPGRPAYIAARR